MIPQEFRPSGIEYYYDRQLGWARLDKAWKSDEFVLDPTRVTIHVGRTGMDGDTFKKLLMDRFDIQINKTSRNTVLFMIHIGMTRGTVAHLVKVLTEIAHELDDRLDRQSAVEKREYEQRVASLTRDLPPLPHFSRFHRAFLPAPDRPTAEGDIRKAFFLAHDGAMCEYLKLDGPLCQEVQSGREVVAASFVTPYPPGFPVLVPGQVVTPDILAYLSALDVREIHGYDPNFGLRVFTQTALDQLGWVDDAAAAGGPQVGPVTPPRIKSPSTTRRV
jgi:arginine decarboxylase